ncbi:unnamed protein product [Merluccius merluccius]
MWRRALSCEGRGAQPEIRGVQAPLASEVKPEAQRFFILRRLSELSGRFGVERNQKVQAEILSGTMWFWMLWHFWHSSDDVLGHFEWPDASKWTDEELGIPADDEE